MKLLDISTHQDGQQQHQEHGTDTAKDQKAPAHGRGARTTGISGQGARGQTSPKHGTVVERRPHQDGTVSSCTPYPCLRSDSIRCWVIYW